MLINIIISLIILAMITSAILYIYKSKKKGNVCIGCPCNGQCSKCNHES